MELILGLKPMSQFDAAARPMYASFQAKPDLRPYEHVVPKVDLNEKNPPTAWGAELSEKFDLAKEDAADDLLFNEVIWRSVKGAELADAAAGAGGVRLPAFASSQALSRRPRLFISSAPFIMVSASAWQMETHHKRTKDTKEDTKKAFFVNFAPLW